jgi:hypothetical protein
VGQFFAFIHRGVAAGLAPTAVIPSPTPRKFANPIRQRIV